MNRQALYLVAACAALAGCNHSGSSSSTARVGVAPTTPVAQGAPLAAVSPMNMNSATETDVAVELISEGDTVRLAYAAGGPVVYTDPNAFGPGTAYGTRTENGNTVTYYANGADRMRTVDMDYARLAIVSAGDADRTHAVAHGAIDPNAVAPTGMTGTATYTGTYSGQLADPTADHDVNGRIALSADFDNATITGRVDQLELASGGGTVPSAATIELENGVINGATYNGTARVTREGVDWQTGGPGRRNRFEGAFHGDQAQETVGSVIVVGTDPVVGESRVVGGFVARAD